MKRGRSCVHLSIFSGGGTGGRPESKMEISKFAGVIVQRLHCIVDQYLHQNRDNISLPKPFDNVHKKRETFLIAMRQKSSQLAGIAKRSSAP